MPQPTSIERRIHIRAYAFEKVCEASIRSTLYRVDLIDISPGGSRLRFPAGHVAPLDENEVVTLSCADPSLTGLINGISAEVRWISAREFGVRFLEELPMTTSDIQRLLAPPEK